MTDKIDNVVLGCGDSTIKIEIAPVVIGGKEVGPSVNIHSSHLGNITQSSTFFTNYCSLKEIGDYFHRKADELSNATRPYVYLYTTRNNDKDNTQLSFKFE